MTWWSLSWFRKLQKTITLTQEYAYGEWRSATDKEVRERILSQGETYHGGTTSYYTYNAAKGNQQNRHCRVCKRFVADDAWVCSRGHRL